MPGLGALYTHDVKALVLGGLAVILRNAQLQKEANFDVLAGELAFAEYVCTCRLIPWGGVLDDLRAQLQPDSVELLDQALSLGEPASQ